MSLGHSKTATCESAKVDLVFPTHLQMMRTNVCIITPHQALQLEINGILPSCREHRHLSRSRAEELIADHIVFRDDRGDFVRYVEAQWVGKHKRFITFIRSRAWERRDSAGTVVMQLVPAGGAW